MDELKRLRKQKGLSQAKLAALADIDPSTVNQIERGAREASPATLRKLAAALGVSIADLLEDTSPKAPGRSPFEPSFNDVIEAERRADVNGPDPEEWGPDSERPRREAPGPGGQDHSRTPRDSIDVRDAVTTQIEEIVRALDRREITADEAVAKLQELMAA